MEREAIDDEDVDGDQPSQPTALGGGDPVAAVTGAATLAELDMALGRLPARERDVVVALNGHGEDTVSIGHRHGLARRSVIELAYRTRRRLRALLQAA